MTRPWLPVLLAVGLAAGAAGCSAEQPLTPAAAVERATALPPTATPTKPAGPSDPLTGVAPKPTSPVVIVKVDGSPLARPFLTGLGSAAVVYQELMEGGATRFLAVYADGLPSEVGPVRSVRESDIELLRQFGKVAVASSGGNKGVLRTFAAAARRGQLLDASYDALPTLYRKGSLRPDAWNYFVRPGAIADARPSAVSARDVGFRFGPTTTGGTPVAALTASYSNLSRFGATWNGSGWQVLQDGAELSGVQVDNVIVQRVRVRATDYVDVVGNRTPYTVTVGKGTAVLFRDGKRIEARWSRPSATKPTTWKDAAGKPLLLAPGRTWVVLLPTGRPLTTR